MARVPQARRGRVAKLDVPSGRKRPRDRIRTEPWTPERESQVQRIVYRSFGQSPQALAFYKAALIVMKRFTNPRHGAGRRIASAQENRETLERLRKSIKRTRMLMTKASESSALFSGFAEQWEQSEYRVMRWGAFSFPTPLLKELEDVAAVVQVRSSRGTPSQGRRDIIVAELARMYERCFSRPVDRSPRGDFGRLVKALLPLCGYRARLADMLAGGFKLFDTRPQVIYAIRLEGAVPTNK